MAEGEVVVEQAVAPVVAPEQVTSVDRRILWPRVVPMLHPNDPYMRVAIGVPMERTINQHAFFSFWSIAINGWPLIQLDYTRNDIARHKFAEFMAQGHCTHLLMLDSDHVHPNDIVQRLARWFIAYPDLVQVVGGLNYRRGEPFDPCAFVSDGGKLRRMAEWGAGAIEVDALGTGSIMIARSALEKMTPPYFRYDYSEWEGWPGTDMYFSAECKKLGITLWCDTTTTSPHIGDMFIDDKAYRAWIAKNGVPPDQTLEKTAPMVKLEIT